MIVTIIRSVVLWGLTSVASAAFAWDGYNYDTGTYIEIDSYDHQYQGEGEVEYFDYSSDEYRTGYLDMYPDGTGVLTDDETGEEYDVEME